MFLGARDAVKEDMNNIIFNAIVDKYGLCYPDTKTLAIPKEVLFTLANQVKRSPGFPQPVPDSLTYLQIITLKNYGLVRGNNDSWVLTKRGYKLAKRIGEAVEIPKNFNRNLQRSIKSTRSKINDVAFNFFLFDKFWWRHLSWSLRKWWSETKPEPRPIMDMGEISPRALWSEDDEARNKQMWVESRYTAFWLCPDGIWAGIEKLKRLEDGTEQLAIDVLDPVIDQDNILEILPKSFDDDGKPKVWQLMEEFDRVWEEEVLPGNRPEAAVSVEELYHLLEKK